MIGAGPAGLTAAWELANLQRPVLLLEADPHYVGGLARTVKYKGNRFDIGGHRFYSKSELINALWLEMLPNDFIEVSRLSRIYYDRKFFPYPLELGETLRNLGARRSFSFAWGYLEAQLFPRHPEISLEDWVINRFGNDLYHTFFKTYTEKVWGIPCISISKDFAAQRIRGLSLLRAVKDSLLPAPRDNDGAKTLIKSFIYPRLGPGQLWESVLDRVLAEGNRLELGKTVVRVNHARGRVFSVGTQDGCTYEGDYFYPTMTLRDFILALDPPAAPKIRQAASSLSFRDFLIVALIVGKAELFPDNWIYIHDPGIHVGRIQNYKNWSSDMVADEGQTCLGMEYFCCRGDHLWEMNDSDLVKLAMREVDTIGVARASECVDGCVVRMPNAYPVYDQHYRQHRDTIKAWLSESLKNVFPCGRGGLHNYNSQDHAMMTAILSVQNMDQGLQADVWAVNTDEEYAETGEAANVERQAQITLSLRLPSR